MSWWRLLECWIVWLALFTAEIVRVHRLLHENWSRTKTYKSSCFHSVSRWTAQCSARLLVLSIDKRHFCMSLHCRFVNIICWIMLKCYYSCCSFIVYLGRVINRRARHGFPLQLTVEKGIAWVLRYVDHSCIVYSVAGIEVWTDTFQVMHWCWFLLANKPTCEC